MRKRMGKEEKEEKQKHVGNEALEKRDKNS